MLDLLRDLRKKVVIGFVGGSDLVKIVEQLGPTGSHFDILYICLIDTRIQRWKTGTLASQRTALPLIGWVKNLIPSLSSTGLVKKSTRN